MTPIFTAAQNTQTITYTVKNGLPSNALYRTAIDKNGFLWIASENGLSRFDGKKFKNYSTADGLSDNEITDLFIDSSGTIWAIPFQHTPCYYNPTTDRFENETTNSELEKITKGTLHQPHLLKHGGVAFGNYKKQIFIYQHGKMKQLEHPYFKALLEMVDYQVDKFLLFSADSIRLFADGKFKNLLPVHQNIIMCESEGNMVYMATHHSILQYRYSDMGEITFLGEKKYPFEVRIFCKTGKRFAITSVNGNTYLLNKNTLELSEIISATEGMQVRNVLEDKDNNIWLSTMDHGLVKVQRKRISSLANGPLQQNFNSIIKTNSIITGNNNGEIYKYDGLYLKKIQLNQYKNIDTWIRKIINTQFGIYIATQSGSFLLNEQTLQVIKTFTGAENRSSKAVYKINDSVLLMGNHANAFLYNLKNNRIIDSVNKRVISLGCDLSGNRYIGSIDGLYCWKQKQLISLATVRNSLALKINTMACSTDNLMWVGLGSDSLLLLRENKWIASIPLGAIIPGNICKVLFCNKAGEIWLGTNKGLNRINYSFKNNQFSFNNTYFGTADGLIGEQVNDITIQDSIVYVATNQGISYLPVQLQLPVANITTFITDISINSKAAELKDRYSLLYNENDITINFSGVDLTGFIPLFEYNVNDGKWQRTEKIELKRLASGKYKIKIRAIRRDGKPSANEALVQFEISTPFWRSTVFWMAIFALILAALLYLQQQRNKQKQIVLVAKLLTEKKITELEMQALKAQINPHFIFNCLNSIKGFIYEKDYAQADKYLDKFAELMRSTVDNSDASIITLTEEIKYLSNYLLLEKLRFEDKFDFDILVDPFINQDNAFIPAMLLQPYVENAIRHGMRYLKNRKGQITILITKDKSFLICAIDDNGIGREKAIALKSKLQITYQGKGMNISMRRAELYNIEQIITDKKDATNIATGTTISVRIPLNLKP